MRRRGLRATALLCLLVGTASVATAGDEPTWPGWLVGRWEATSPDGPTHLGFEPDGTLAYGGTSADGTAWSDAGGRWEVRGASLLVGDASKGETQVAFRIERLPEEGGRPGLRLVEAGHEATAPVHRKAIARPRWLLGTWVTQGPQGARRWVFLADGRVRRAAEVGTEVEHVDVGRWEERAGRLQLGREDRPPVEFDLLPPEEGRLRMRLREAGAPDPPPVWTRASWLPPQSYEGALLGRWDVVGAALPTAWFFGPYGRYERRRAFDAGVFVERGTFSVATGATGEVLQLTSDAGHRRSLGIRLAGGVLRTTDASRGTSMEAKFLDGSNVGVAVDAIDEAAQRADVEATFRFLRDDRVRVAPSPTAPSAPPTRESGGGDAAPADPAPHDVFAGMEAFRKPRTFRFESEQVLVRDAASRRVVLGETPDALARALPGSARPRVVIRLTFRPDGRVVESTDTWDLDGTGDPVTVVQHGKYGLQGDVVLVQFDGGREMRWHLAEAGRYLHRGEATCMDAVSWGDMGLDGPKWPW